MKRFAITFTAAIIICLGYFLTACANTSSGSELKVYCFQAGKADAFLLYTENSAALIDTDNDFVVKTFHNKNYSFNFD